MRRRDFIKLGTSAMALPTAVRAQHQTGIMYRVGYLGGGPASRLLETLRQSLGERGWVEGQNIATKYRLADGRYERLAGLADELVRSKMDVIVASPTAAAMAAMN